MKFECKQQISQLLILINQSYPKSITIHEIIDLMSLDGHQMISLVSESLQRQDLPKYECSHLLILCQDKSFGFSMDL